MPLYYFQVHAGNKADRFVDDPLELPDEKAAWEEATAALGELLRELAPRFEAVERLSIEVQDERRRILRSITVSGKVHD